MLAVIKGCLQVFLWMKLLTHCTMKKILLVLTALMLALSCSKEGANPEVVISSPTNNAVGKDGGTVTLSFSSAIEWTATSSATWCTLSASKGDGGNSLSIKVTCAKNETYDSRTATVTIKSGGTVAKSITIEQDAKDGLIISSNRMDLNNDAQQITITLQKNVEYTYTINGEWITPVTASSVETKALSNETLKFNVAENTTYDNREGSITFKSAKGDLSSTVTIYQSQVNAIIISKKDVTIDATEQVLNVAIKTNVDFEVSIPEDAKSWISVASTKALVDKTVTLSIKENELADERKASITIKDSKTQASDILNITQAGRDGVIILGEKMAEVEASAGSQEITVFHSEAIAAECEETWVTVSVVESPNESTTKYKITWVANDESLEREAKILFKETKPEGRIDTFTLKQKGAKGFLSATTPGLYNLESEEAEYAYSKYEHLLVIAPAVSAAKGYFRLVQNKENAFLSVENIPDMARLAAESTVELQIVQNITTRMQYSHKRVFTVAKISENLVWLKSESDNIGLVIQMK